MTTNRDVAKARADAARARDRERRALARRLAEQLDNLAREAENLARAADLLTVDPDNAPNVLGVLARTAANPRKARPAAKLDRLLSDARQTAVALARANSARNDRGLTDAAIGDALGIDRRNLPKTYAREGDDQR